MFYGEVPTDLDEFKDKAVTVHFVVDWIARSIAYRIAEFLSGVDNE